MKSLILKKKEDIKQKTSLEENLQKQIAFSSGVQRQSDPSFHLAENFMQSFDALGSLHAESFKKASPGLTDAMGKKISNTPENTGLSEESSMEENSLHKQTDMGGDFEEKRKEPLLSKFSEMSFKRGKLSAGIVKGSGDMMLFSCIKRTYGKTFPNHIQQRKLFDRRSSGGKPRNTTNAQDTALFRNKGFENSALALVCDVTKDARRNVEQMSELAQKGGSNMGTFGKLYPFLSCQKEDKLLLDYENQLKNSQNPEEKALLNKAITKTKAIKEKKESLKNQFIFKLRALADQAKEASAIFSDEEFQTLLHSSIEKPYQAPPEGNPPEDSPVEKTKDDDVN